MQTKIRISILLLMVTVTSFSQSVNKIPTMPEVARKGIITMPDGTMFYYKHLQFKNDSVFYQNFDSAAQKMALQEISQITKDGSYAGTGALIGGGSGLIFGIAMAKALDDTGDFLQNISTLGQDHDLNTRKLQTATIIESTVVGIGLGALVGALFSKDKIIFSNSIPSISFKPSIYLGPAFNHEVAITCRIILR